MSPPQIDALSALSRDPAAIPPKNILRALQNRGLVDTQSRLTSLGRNALGELRKIDPRSASATETRIHLDNEPATLSQLRLLRKLWGYCPRSLSKNDASLLITFVKEQRRAATEDCEQRLKNVETLIRSRAQAVDAIAFSDTGPFRTGSGAWVRGFIEKITRTRRSISITIGVLDAQGKKHLAKPIPLRLAGDVPITSSKAREAFETLANSVQPEREAQNAAE